MTERYDYHVGFKSYDAAAQAVDDAMAESEISFSEKPAIECYLVIDIKSRKLRRYKITLEA